MEDVTVIEENFDKIINGTVDNPGYDFVSRVRISEITIWQTPHGWQHSLYGQTAWRGRRALHGIIWLSRSASVASSFTLKTTECAFDVEFTAYNTQPDDVIFCMILNELTDQQALDSRNLPDGK